MQLGGLPSMSYANHGFIQKIFDSWYFWCLQILGCYIFRVDVGDGLGLYPFGELVDRDEQVSEVA